MNFKEIAAVTGKPGLFKILKPTRTGVVLESLDAQKQKTVISSNTKVSILNDISMYTLSAEGNMPLPEILYKVHQTYAGNLPVNPKSEEPDLRKFFISVVPDYDAEKVYASDIKKLVSWYMILNSYLPEILTPVPEETTENVQHPANAAPSATNELEAKPAKTTKKKSESPEAAVDKPQKPTKKKS